MQSNLSPKQATTKRAGVSPHEKRQPPRRCVSRPRKPPPPMVDSSPVCLDWLEVLVLHTHRVSTCDDSMCFMDCMRYRNRRRHHLDTTGSWLRRDGLGSACAQKKRKWWCTRPQRLHKEKKGRERERCCKVQIHKGERERGIRHTHSTKKCAIAKGDRKKDWSRMREM